jgi:RND family efflux transporter MFP subunit
VAGGEYRVTAHATVQGEVQRAVVAPFDGYIAASSARAGDRVAAGQELGRLDDKDLVLEQQNLTSQRGQLVGEYREALAGHDRAESTVKKARIDQIDAQLALVDEKLRRTRMTAPFDGLIVTGDISQSLGATVERGQVLFEMAPLDGYRVILQVDERDVADVAVGQSGALVLSSLPDERFRFSVAKITPVAESEEGKNFFRVEAKLEEGSERLRPGMEGVSKIEIGDRKLAWIWTHRLTDWLRLWSWTWLP